MSNLDKFEFELNLMGDLNIRKFTEKVIEEVPDYFWKIASSSTGKYHPIDEIKEGGLLLHTKRVVKLSDDLCRNFSISGVDRDCVIAAAIMHDFCKNGFPYDQNRTVQGHGCLWINIVSKFMKQEEILNSKFVTIIGRLIANHMGKWDIPYTMFNSKLDLILQVADYVASRRYVAVNVEDK